MIKQEDIKKAIKTFREWDNNGIWKTPSQAYIQHTLKKSQYVQWHDNNRKEYYAVFAKSFKEKPKDIIEKNVLLFDLKDIENAI